MTNDLPAVKVLNSTAMLSEGDYDDLIARLFVAEGRLAAHHGAYDITCPDCQEVVAL